ncbi:MAG: hypothetical protein OEZ39_11565 [Gammaproteobacteria bacterium]|nr:hypothetical protein [Gammaproteobacteria bacterium]MDH5652481.1 hypothetical protein [Gammaproteobacteria bacterium]
MEQNNRSNDNTDIISLGGKAWTAYVRVILTALFLFLIVTPAAWSASAMAGVIILAGSLAVVAYQFLLLRSFHLYFDDVGVWVYSGILPWSKGITGVKWRDLDEAVYFQSIGSWLFKSYSIRIAHRYTKSSEIILSHWTRGDEAVMTINGQHQELVRAGMLSSV